MLIKIEQRTKENLLSAYQNGFYWFYSDEAIQQPFSLSEWIVTFIRLGGS